MDYNVLCVKQQSYNFLFDLWKIDCGQIWPLVTMALDFWDSSAMKKIHYRLFNIEYYGQPSKNVIGSVHFCQY